MDTDTLINLLYVGTVLLAVTLAILVDFRFKILRLKQKNYFLNRDKQRYAETIFASKDGYFAFIYPDDQIQTPQKSVREKCSSRLAVMLDLKQGKNATFEDVLDVFYKEDARKLKKYLALMQSDGITFESTFQVKNLKKKIRIFSNRINGSDGSLYSDMLWFRDLSAEQIKIEELQDKINAQDANIKTLQDLFDHIQIPCYIRDEKLDLAAYNKQFQTLFLSDKETDKAFSKTARDLAQLALQTNRPQVQNFQLISQGQIRYFELHETPFHNADELDKIGTVGYLADVTALDTIRRDFKTHQNAHLEVLSSLGSAFAIFDNHAQLIFYNPAFRDMWHIEASALDAKMTYASFLNTLRAKRMLPEVSDFKAYKAQEEQLFGTLIEPKENLLHLPDGRTIRRLVAQHPNGLIFAYEDVSDKLAAERMIAELMSVQKNILDALSEAVLIFYPDGRLKAFNDAYCRLFNAKAEQLQNLPTATEVFDMQHPCFEKVEHWENLKQHMSKHIFEICAPFQLECDDAKIIEVKPVILADESIFVLYTEKR